QEDELPFLELVRIDLRVDVDAHRAAVDHDLGRPVLVRAREDAIAVGRRAELVDLLLEELDLLLRLLERVDELLVLPLRVGELLAHEVIATPRGVVLREQALEPPAELGRVRPEEAQRVLELLDGIGRRTALAIGVVAGARPRSGDPAHHVAHESLPSRAAAGVVELAHRTLSSSSSVTREPPSPRDADRSAMPAERCKARAANGRRPGDRNPCADRAMACRSARPRAPVSVGRPPRAPLPGVAARACASRP